MCAWILEQIRALDCKPQTRGPASLVRQGFSSAPYTAFLLYPSLRKPRPCPHLDRRLLGRWSWRLGSCRLRRSEWQRKSFSKAAPRSWPWRGDVGEHLICQIELFAVLGVRLHLRQELRQRRVIFWIDNESARFVVTASREAWTAL